jgi:hypothetical protein
MIGKIIAIALCILFSPQAHAVEDDAPFAQGVALNLRDPEFCDGVLTTSGGGVVTAPDLRVQASCIESRRQVIDNEAVFTIYAKGNLMLEYGEHIFTGGELHYDFQAHRGVIYNGRGMFHPWYVGASCIELLPNGDYKLHKGFLSTSPAWDPEWRIAIGNAYLTKDRMLTASNVQFKIVHLPILWMPYLKTHLDWLLDSPVRYRLRWGGPQGPRFGITYKLFDRECFKTFLRLDYRLSRGPGLALETEAYSPDQSEIFLTRNYVARDSAIDDPHERFRYRFQGYYNKCICAERANLNITYDKISDEDMPRDYSDEDLELKTAQRTQLHFRGQNDYVISDFKTRIRVNDFETLKEDLPAFGLTLHPFTLGPTGIIAENRFHFGYHDFRFSKTLPAGSNDYSSTRAEFRHNLYRPFSSYYATLTPETGLVAIYYGNSEDKSSKWVVLGQFGTTLSTQAYNHYGPFKHVLEPYVKYEYFTTPSTSPDQHFIFDIEDGWYRLNTMRVGGRNLIYQKCINGCIAHRLTLDLYTYTFFDTPAIGSTAPRLYAEAIWDTSASLRHTTLAVWNRKKNIVDEFNFRSQWTGSENFAIDVEYRHRSPYYWRRLDPNNFIMDSIRTESELRNSPVSDRRSTVLLHAFYRLHHDTAIEFLYQHGWDRITQPYYREYQIDLLKTIRSTWHIKLSYQQKENDHRVAIHIKIGLKKPECPCNSSCFSLLD